MTQHTPGPWKIGRGADGYPIIHTSPDSFSPSGQGVAHVCKRSMCQDHLANARLIAAAPDLLASLKEFMDSRAPDMAEAAHPGAAERARAAIAKAARA